MSATDAASGVRRAFNRLSQPGGRGSRRRKLAKTFSIRLSEEERQTLSRDAGTLPVGTYIRMRLFGDHASQGRTARPPKRLHSPNVDQITLARVLALLGRTELYASLKAIGQAALLGTIPASPDLIQELHTACADVRLMRSSLMTALKVQAGVEDDSRR